MKVAGREEMDQMQDEDDAVSLCSMFAGSESFGIDTRKIREVLGCGPMSTVSDPFPKYCDFDYTPTPTRKSP